MSTQQAPEAQAVSLHVYTAPQRRTRAWCPVHQRLCYARRQAYYDTIRLWLDCGASVDLGYGYWYGLPGPRGGRGRMRPLRKRDWPHWRSVIRRGLEESA